MNYIERPEYMQRLPHLRGTPDIIIIKASITDLDTDAVVNAANDGLRAGSGVCGAIFQAAGYDQLQAACHAIGHCDTGSAVITPGFHMKAKYIIHAVGPIYSGGKHHEQALLYGAYNASLKLAVENKCHSIGFPLISTGVFGYPKEEAWRTAIQACQDFLAKHPHHDIQIVFAIRDHEVLSLGQSILSEVSAADHGASISLA